jgi:hypothetical protein
VMTYPFLKPYLTGLHIRIDGWRRGRDDAGWRLSARKQAEGNLENRGKEPEEICELVKLAPRLKSDMEELMRLANTPEAPLYRVRCATTKLVHYGFGDASGAAFGGTMAMEFGVDFEYGQWCYEDLEMSSNWKELRNLVGYLKRVVRENGLYDCEMFIFTDNTTAENAFWKGTSKSKYLSDLIVELRELERDYRLHLHVCHVSGKRMILQGTDGLSRGDYSEGVMRGENFLKFIPIGIDPFARSNKLKEFSEYITQDLGGTPFLKPNEWFEEHHAFGNFVWSPPLAAADVVVDLLGKARHKRPQALHIIFVPRLMTGRWRRHMTRGSDTSYLSLKWTSVWDTARLFEPLLMFICFPFSCHAPLLQERSKLVEECNRLLQSGNLHETSDRKKWDFLRKLLSRARHLCPL